MNVAASTFSSRKLNHCCFSCFAVKQETKLQYPALRSQNPHTFFVNIKSTVNMAYPDETAETSSQVTASKDGGVEITCFTEVFDEATVHFQIMRLNKQIYVWIGCDSAKMGSLYAAAPTRPHNEVSVASLLAGTSDNTGSGIARRLVLRTGLNIVLACNLPKNNSMLEISAEKKLAEKLISLGYTKPRSINQHELQKV